MKKAKVYNDLLNVFREIQGKEASEISAAVRKCDLPDRLKEAICHAVRGDNRPLNDWLFTDGLLPGQCIAWVAPVRANLPRYVWMVGAQNSTSIEVHRWFAGARISLSEDRFLIQDKVPPSLLFIDTIEVSSVSVGELGYEDEFSVFQVGYKDAPVEVSDLDQNMVINTSFALNKRQEALARLQRLGWLDDILTIEKELELFSIIHNEGHNQGHFVGAWPFEDQIKKKCLLYEAVEEFKACLASIAMAEHLPLTDIQKDNYALCVFISRFLGFGFDAYCLTRQRRETAREITVGLMFFEWLVKCEVIKFDRLGMIFVKAKEVRPTLMRAYRLIFTQETSLERNNHNGLKSVARLWYELAFPGGKYSQQAESVYNLLQEAPTVTT